MRKGVLISTICLAILLMAYYLVYHNTHKTIVHSKINVSEVQSVTIDERNYKIQDDTSEITKIISMYNKATILRKDDDTTPSHIIIIQLRTGQRVEVAVTTQGFHYVSDGEKSYKISSHSLTEYLRGEKKQK